MESQSKIEVEYYFLDNEERKRFAQNSQEILISQIKEEERTEINNEYNTNLKKF